MEDIDILRMNLDLKFAELSEIELEGDKNGRGGTEKRPDSARKKIKPAHISNRRDSIVADLKTLGKRYAEIIGATYRKMN